MAYYYCKATNTGKGFITHQECVSLEPKSYGTELWKIKQCPEAKAWIKRHNAEVIHKNIVQETLDTLLTSSQSQWDASALLQEQKSRPVREVLE